MLYIWYILILGVPMPCQPEVTSTCLPPCTPGAGPDSLGLVSTSIMLGHTIPIGELFLVLVDTHSKWLDRDGPHNQFYCVPSKSRGLLATHGLQEVIMPHNGTAFNTAGISETEWSKAYYFRTLPSDPSTNGLVEKVQTQQILKQHSPVSCSTTVQLRTLSIGGESNSPPYSKRHGALPPFSNRHGPWIWWWVFH